MFKKALKYVSILEKETALIQKNIWKTTLVIIGKKIGQNLIEEDEI